MRLAPRNLTTAVIALAVLSISIGVSLTLPTPVASAEPLSYSMWGDAVKPKNPIDVDRNAVELGTRFKVSRPGQITQLRIYRGRNSQGTRAGTLWSSDGKVLARATFRARAAAGWQVAKLSRPVAVQNGRQYVVSYLAPHGGYSGDTQGLARPSTAYALTALRGVYTYGGGFPTDVWRSTNYYVDVVYRPTPPAIPNSTPVPTAVSPTATPMRTPFLTPPRTSAPVPTPTPQPSSQPTNCAPLPSACGYPDATNTGVRPGTTLKKSGSVAANRYGQVIDGLDITGEINVTASNVVIKNSRITGGRGAGSADWVVIVRPGAENLVIQDSEIMTPNGSAQDIACVLNIGDTRPQVVRSNIHACSAGVSSGGGTIRDSYFHDMSHVEGLSHNVGIASNGGGGMTIWHNTVFNQYAQTATIAFYQDFGTQSDNVVEDNLLAGGGYCLYGGAGQKGPTRNVRFVNNRLSDKFYPKCGSYGVLASFTSTDPGNVFVGNYWDKTLRPAG